MNEKPHQEIEIKLSCAAKVLADVMAKLRQASPVPLATRQLRTVYYDTSNFSLRRKAASLRIRIADSDVPLLGFKAPIQPSSNRFHRYEVEVAAPGGQLDLSLFDEPTLQIYSRFAGTEELRRQFEVQVKRQLLRAKQGSTEIEIAADEGAVMAAGHSSQVCELELELKSGPELGLIDYAIGLVEKFPLTLDFVTKSDRGYLLIDKASAIVPEQPNLRLTADMGLDGIIEATLSQSLYRFTYQWHGLREKPDAAAIHQMRIALRELRNALSIFSKVRPCEEFGQIKRKARILVASLGQARNFDVLAELADGDLIVGPGLAALRSLIVEKQAACRKDVLEELNAPDPSLFVLQVQRLIASQGWRLANYKGSRKTDGAETGHGVRQILEGLYSRVLARGRGFSQLSDIELHELRLAIKALNFACVTLANMISNEAEVTTFNSALSKLQKGLGVYNDKVFALQFCDEVESGTNLQAKLAAATLRSMVTEHQAGSREKLKADWTSFKALAPCWA